jgi:hypothetical protein
LASSSRGTCRGCGRQRLGNPALRPFPDGPERLLKGAPLFRQHVFHPHGGVRHHHPVYDPFGFQLSQPFRQHPVADIGDRRAELGEAHPALEEQLDDRTGPAAADELDRAVKPDAELGFEAHGFHFSLKDPT